jgi:hypothetical protein
MSEQNAIVYALTIPSIIATYGLPSRAIFQFIRYESAISVCARGLFPLRTVSTTAAGLDYSSGGVAYL